MKCLFLCAMAAAMSISSTTFATEITGFGKQYERMDKEQLTPVVVQQNIIPEVTIDGMPVHFEKDNIKGISKTLRGSVFVNSETTWTCFNSPEQHKTYWFVSDNEMEHGDLSGIAVSVMDTQAGCSDTNRKINISLNDIGLGSTLSEVASAYKIKRQITNSLILESDKAVGNEYTQSNTISYYLHGGKVYGVLYTQITAN